MTSNQLQYQSNLIQQEHNRNVEAETNRANLVREQETERSNRAQEYENYRSHVAQEQNQQFSNLINAQVANTNAEHLNRMDKETNRANLAKENQALLDYYEKQRANKANEAIGNLSSNAQYLRGLASKQTADLEKQLTSAKKAQLLSQANLNNANAVLSGDMRYTNFVNSASNALRAITPFTLFAN